MEDVRSVTPADSADGKPTERWEELLDRLAADAEAISDRTAEKLLATIPGYEEVKAESVKQSSLRNSALTIRLIKAGAQPQPADLPEATMLAEERISQHVPLGSVLSGFRTSLSDILQHMVDLGPEYDIDPRRMLRWSTMMWAINDVFSTRATLVYRDHEISQAVADSVRRSEWIGKAVAEGAPMSELLWGAAMYDVPADAPLRALAAATADNPDAEKKIQEWARRAGVRVLTSVRPSVIVGIVIGRPNLSVAGPNFAIGLGGARVLSKLYLSYADASLVLKAADGLGLKSVVKAQDLTWKLAIHSSPRVTEILAKKYLDPLRESGEFAQDIIESLQAYLDNQMNIPAAAKSIPVHVNTLRYRLRRFEELTNTHVGDVRTLIEVAWVLEAIKKDF
ncbi:regulator of polyketide synthase expression [Corynebacterium deserti GIMN1.010]|uniref:Regulator of polyketide synthase expression n=1 Tax=Corynebacterium deserti GIMN1.010 TaxID=931089 RepID=A0A0M3QA00_9CORY|nr:helix-turn-helix domain-containing protein [Corynebacterium deserti]ALC06629.1 regulator of polyketide synthase expression [Corynebacterium deserti GIMN1.010]